MHITSLIDVAYSTYFLHILLLQHGDIETNPGPQKEKKKNLSCCYWNVNSLIAHNLSKLSQLEAYNSVCKHDFICISETFFDSSIQERDKTSKWMATICSGQIIQVNQDEVVFVSFRKKL